MFCPIYVSLSVCFLVELLPTFNCDRVAEIVIADTRFHPVDTILCENGGSLEKTLRV